MRVGMNITPLAPLTKAIRELLAKAPDKIGDAVKAIVRIKDDK